jgi:predicted ATP-dependent endonuclease of OLD family
MSRELNISSDEVRFLHTSLLRRYATSTSNNDLFSRPRLALEHALIEFIPNRTLYLPTYRRIEKDLKEIFPDLEERFRGRIEGRSALQFARSSAHYIDLVSFGMEDVRTNVEARMRALRDYSLEQFNALSARYLKDVIKGTADQYSPAQIASLSEENLAAILNRVSEQVLSSEDKDLLRTKITEMKGKRKNQLDVNDLYLAHYFTRLIRANAEISKQETEIVAFVDVCNAYLQPGKSIVYDETKFSLQIIDDDGISIDLSVLSSGEKQVVSLFSHLYLDDARDQIVIIDEPELSLSVPWQKRFLTDILASNHCSFVLSVTHSPFIYQNRLEKCAIDLRRRITSAK